jgi:hypothetical protein
MTSPPNSPVTQERSAIDRMKDYDKQLGYVRFDEPQTMYLKMLEEYKSSQKELKGDIEDFYAGLDMFKYKLEKIMLEIEELKKTPIKTVMDSDAITTMTMIFGGMLIVFVGTVKDVFYLPQLGLVSIFIGIWHLLIGQITNKRK